MIKATELNKVDNVIMNYSTASHYDNVETPKQFSDSVLYQAIESVLSAAGEVNKMFCPLCLETFEYQFSLMEHLQRYHNRFLIDKRDVKIELEPCPFCYAKFYGRHLMAKHVLHNHSNVIAALYFGQDCNKDITCIYCSSKFKQKSFMFVYHIQEEHFLDFCEAFFKRFLQENTVDSKSPTGMKKRTITKSNEPCFFSLKGNAIHHNETDFVNSSNINCFDFTELKEQLENINTSSYSTFKTCSFKKSILKPHSVNEENRGSTTKKRSARRILRFDIPESISDKENTFLFNEMESFEKFFDESSLLSESIFKGHAFSDSFYNTSGRPRHCSTPKAAETSECTKKTKLKEVKKTQSCGKSTFKSYINKDGLNAFGFQCGKCNFLFQENKDLVKHVKRNHKKLTLNLLQPYYQCGICNARFFKNGYLKKHFKLHNIEPTKRSLPR